MVLHLKWRVESSQLKIYWTGMVKKITGQILIMWVIQNMWIKSHLSQTRLKLWVTLRCCGGLEPRSSVSLHDCVRLRCGEDQAFLLCQYVGEQTSIGHGDN